MADYLERMQALELVAVKLASTAREAKELAFNLMELEEACADVAERIEGLRKRAIEQTPVMREDLIALLSHLRHWRGHERQVRKVIDRAIDQMPARGVEGE